MSCCGNKKDVPSNSKPEKVPVPSQKNSDPRKSSLKQTKSKSQVKAVKVFGANSEIPTQVSTKEFRAVPEGKVGNYGFKTRPQDYDEQSVVGHKSNLIGRTDELDFKLDDGSGVANTFDIPTYDYQTLLNHSFLSRMNSRSKYIFDDGNEGKRKMQN